MRMPYQKYQGPPIIVVRYSILGCFGQPGLPNCHKYATFEVSFLWSHGQKNFQKHFLISNFNQHRNKISTCPLFWQNFSIPVIVDYSSKATEAAGLEAVAAAARGVGLDEGHELSPTMSTLNEGQKQGRVSERGAGGKGEHSSSSSWCRRRPPALLSRCHST